MEDSGYHPINHHPLRIVLGWWTVDITLSFILFNGGSGYHPLKHSPLIVLV